MFSTFPAALIDPQQTVGPPSAVEDQPPKQIAGLEDEEELDQFRERNLNLHVGLQVAQECRRLLTEKHEKHHVLATEHERCKKLMQKAIENLSRGLHLSTRELANLGLTVEGVAPARQLGKLVVRPALSKLMGKFTVRVSLLAVQAEPQLSKPTSSTNLQFSSTPRSLSFFWPRAFQTEGLDAPKPPFPGSASGSIPCTSRPLATTPSPAVGTAAGLRNPPQVGELALSTFGDPEQTIVPGVPDTTCVLVSIPGFCNRAEQSFEETRLRRYAFYDGESEPLVTPKWPETTFGQDFSPQSNERNIGEERGGWEGQTPRSMDTAGASSERGREWGGAFKPAKPNGDNTANVTSASKAIGEHYTATPYQHSGSGR
ncbi:hypothetical protein HO133_009839 [Letharia lupina]|uniref:Uncharacterized protein n=1 Tax=Letharia lupina TaxID=560253 RepID=A0A8H6CM11_9LECA|nr:uncharacterized protein HO133_009839 [Letharia lupina]KAF6225837.1 hypothetical protein HO133_009839 [Letharia lupina]